MFFSVKILPIIVVHYFIPIHFVASRTNNACANFEDYANLSSENCFDNPDMLLETPGLIKKYAGEYKAYRVTTKDGYILTIFRIPRENYKGVIFLHHPLGSDSRVWVGLGNDSLAFYLWRAGYDIWLNNNRGTLFSQKHQTLSYRDFKYWDYSFHEVGYYDIPAEVELIKKETNNSKIIYIGNSFGTSSGLVYGSLHAKEAKNDIKAFIFMATPAFFKYATTIFKIFVPYRTMLESLIDRLKLSNVLLFLPIKVITKMLFRMYPFLLIVLNVMAALACGETAEKTDAAMLNLDSGIYIKAFSWKIVVHYLQLIETQTRFQMFDYGRIENLKRYKSEIPPAYPIQNFSVPVLFISSDNDSLTTLKDCDSLIEMLPKNLQTDHVKLSTINHMQYFTGKNPKDLYYDQILEYVNKMFKQE